MTKERLIDIFLFNTPHALSFEYRKKDFFKWKAAIDELLKEGRIQRSHKDNKTVTYILINQEGKA